MESNNSIHVGTASGTLLSIITTITSEDILKTTLLATLGAIVSFAVSVALKWFARSKNE